VLVAAAVFGAVEQWAGAGHPAFVAAQVDVWQRAMILKIRHLCA
jgi:hypothetical protein